MLHAHLRRTHETSITSSQLTKGIYLSNKLPLLSIYPQILVIYTQAHTQAQAHKKHTPAHTQAHTSTSTHILGDKKRFGIVVNYPCANVGKHVPSLRASFIELQAGYYKQPTTIIIWVKSVHDDVVYINYNNSLHHNTLVVS